MWNKIKLILKSVREFKIYAIMCPIVMMGEALMECALPFIMSIFIETLQHFETETSWTSAMWTMNYAYTNTQLGWHFNVSLLGLIIAMVVMALISLICGFLGGWLGPTASCGLATNLRKDMYGKIEGFSFANIDKFSESSLITRMTTDIQNVQQAFQMMIRIVVRAPLMLIFSAIMAFITGGAMAWIFVIMIPFICFGLFLIIKKSMTIFRRVFKKYDKLNESVQENVTGVRVVKSFVREDYEKQKFNRASDDMTGEFVHAEKLVALNSPLMNTAIHLSNLLVLALGSWFIYGTNKDLQFKFKLTIGQMTALLTYGVQILMSLMMISMIMVMLVMSIESIRRIGEVLEEESTITNPDNPVMEVADGSVDFDHVNFKYSEKAQKNTLEDIDVHIKSGQFIGILGATGSGKTSVVNLISRLYDVTEGQVRVGGRDVREYDLKTLRDNVAVVLQKNVLFSGTVRSNMKWGNLEATDEEIMKAIETAQISEIINYNAVDLDRKVEEGGSNFSGGQKQRLCIARAILKKPKILILDDSTSAVDTKTDRMIRTNLRKDIPDTTKIVIAQRISSIEGADQIIILDDGKINQIGTHEELLATNKIYQEVYYTQNKVGGNN